MDQPARAEYRAQHAIEAPRRHYIVLPDAHPDQRRAVKLLVPGNSVVLWNSRLLHANESGTQNRPGAVLNRRTADPRNPLEDSAIDGGGNSAWGSML